ncbi:GAK system CofD-like protein [Halomonas halocynthiae]|uniref:GAK system CofD-like protein n=1 Tax=Halomonas halocynthiae TaxID=176290 RepID=UPI00041C6E8F|nr:GAK system CofD-like protein [Halomonas halocynthiae]
MVDVRVTRTALVPDPLRVSRYCKAPELGPRLLFFSGGTALDQVASRLQHYSHNTIHLVTPFDSGGSSAKLRQAFDMPAIGDLRNRLMALADDTVLGHPEVYQLFNHRLPPNASAESLHDTLIELATGRHSLTTAINDPMRQLICNQLGFFIKQMPPGFDLRGASIGNLILAGGYLNNHQQLDPIIFLFSKLVHVRGIVRPTVSENYHLSAVLDDGSQVLGQHRITGKEVAPLASGVAHVGLSAQCDAWVPVSASLSDKSLRLIESAELICYPPGSFHTSVMANLLPRGVGCAVRDNYCPKVYIPNPCPDPEQIGRTQQQLITTLLATLRYDAGNECPNQALLGYILVDRTNGNYPGGIDDKAIEALGIQLIDTPLITSKSAPYYDPDLLITALMSLV